MGSTVLGLGGAVLGLVIRHCRGPREENPEHAVALWSRSNFTGRAAVRSAELVWLFVAPEPQGFEGEKLR